MYNCDHVPVFSDEGGGSGIHCSRPSGHQAMCSPRKQLAEEINLRFVQMGKLSRNMPGWVGLLVDQSVGWMESQDVWPVISCI